MKRVKAGYNRSVFKCQALFFPKMNKSLREKFFNRWFKDTKSLKIYCFSQMLEHNSGTSSETDGRGLLKVKSNILPPSFCLLSAHLYLFLIAPSQICCLLSALSSQMCRINSTAAVPINVHRHSLHTLIFTVFSLPHHVCVCVCVWGRRAAAVSPPLPSKTIVAAVWGGESGRFTHSWRCHQQPRSCLSLTRAQGCTHMQTPPLPFPFKTVLPEKLSIIPSPQWAVFPIHCSDQLNPVDDICSLPPGSSRAYFVCGCDGKAVPALYLKMQMCIY